MKLSALTIIIGTVVVLVLSFIGAQIISRILGKSVRIKADAILQESKEKGKNIE